MVSGSTLQVWHSVTEDLNKVAYKLYPKQSFAVLYEDVQIGTTEEGEPIYEKRIAWQTIDSLRLRDFTPDELPHSQHIAVLKAVNIGQAKPVIVTRRFMGVNYDIQCLVSQNIVSLWQASKIAIGDYMIVSFITEQPGSAEYTIPIVVDKVYKSW